MNWLTLIQQQNFAEQIGTLDLKGQLPHELHNYGVFLSTNLVAADYHR